MINLLFSKRKCIVYSMFGQNYKRSLKYFLYKKMFYFKRLKCLANFLEKKKVLNNNSRFLKRRKKIIYI